MRNENKLEFLKGLGREKSKHFSPAHTKNLRQGRVAGEKVLKSIESKAESQKGSQGVRLLIPASSNGPLSTAMCDPASAQIEYEVPNKKVFFFKLCNTAPSTAHSVQCRKFHSLVIVWNPVLRFEPQFLLTDFHQ